MIIWLHGKTLNVIHKCRTKCWSILKSFEMTLDFSYWVVKLYYLEYRVDENNIGAPKREKYFLLHYKIVYCSNIVIAILYFCFPYSYGSSDYVSFFLCWFYTLIHDLFSVLLSFNYCNKRTDIKNKAKKIKSDYFTKSNREKSNKTITVLEKLTI